MGESFLKLYQNKIDKIIKLTFFSTLIIGFVTHMYKFTNTLLSQDSILNYYSSQNIVSSGRWFLSAACAPSSYFDLPWLIGIVSLLYIAVTAVIIVDVFKIKNPVLAVIVGGLLVTFPCVTETFFFEYTADGYFLAMMLSALSVKFSLIGEKRIISLFVSVICICLSCGIYQAYISFSFIFAICYLIKDILENGRSLKEYFKWIRNQAIIYASSLGLYYLIWKICLKLQNAQPTSYFGIDSVGKMSLANLKGSFVATATSFITFFTNDIRSNGFTVTGVIGILLLVSIIFVFAYSIIKSKAYKQKSKLVLLLICLIAIPFGVYIWYFASGNIYIYGLRMEQSMCVLIIFTAILIDKYVKIKIQPLLSLLLVAFILNNCIVANIVYFNLEKYNDQYRATAVELSTRIHQEDDGNIKSLVFVGGYKTSNYDEDYIKSLSNYMANFNKRIYMFKSETYISLYLVNELGFELSYYKENPDIDEPTIWSQGVDPAPKSWSYKFPVLNDTEREKLINSSEVEKMPCWPNKDSVKAIGSTIVVKLSEDNE